MPEIAMTRRVRLPYEDAVSRIKDALKAEGFGALTEIDVKATLAEKLGVEFRDYVIIGACNPHLAHRALQADLQVGALLPCNVVVYAEGDATVISIFNPEAGMAVLDSDAIESVGTEARAKLERALNAV